MKTLNFFKLLSLSLLVAFTVNTASASSIAKVHLSEAQASQTIVSMMQQGYVPTWIDGFNHKVLNYAPQLYFNLIFEKSSASKNYKAFIGLSAASLGVVKNNLKNNMGMRMIFLESYQTPGGATEYAAIFKSGLAPEVSYVNVSGAVHQNNFNNLTAQGYRLVCRTTVNTNAGPRVAALYDKESVGSWLATSKNSLADASTHIAQQKAAGRTLAHFDFRPVKSFGMIYDSKKNNGWYFKSEMTENQAKSAIAQGISNGYKPTIVSGYSKSVLINGNETTELRYAIVMVKPSSLIGGRTSGTLTIKR